MMHEGVPPPKAANPPAMEGWLWKAGEKHTAYQRRWFRLDRGGQKLWYFADEKHARLSKGTHARNAKGHIDLSLVAGGTGDVRAVAGAPLDFEVVAGDRTWRLRAEEGDEAVAQRWLRKLRNPDGLTPRAERPPEVEAAARRFRAAQQAYRAASSLYADVHAKTLAADVGRSGSSRQSSAGLCPDVPRAEPQAWSATDPRPSHQLGYDAPNAHLLGYLGDKGRVPSHRMRYLPR